MTHTRLFARMNGDSAILRLMDDLGAAINQQSGLPNIELQMLGGGNPAAIAAVEQVFRAEMERLLADGKNFERMVGNYDSPQGNDAFIDSLADFLRCQFAWPVERDNIAITNGSQSAFGVLFNVFAGRYAHGVFKKILLPMTPEYIGYADVGLSKRSLFTTCRPLIEHLDNPTIAGAAYGDMIFKYHLDFDRLPMGDDIGAVCVSRPNNPSGNVITDRELGELHRRAGHAGVPLIIDSAYGLPFPGIVFDDAQPLWDEHVVLCMSLSKLGLPGTRTGIIIARPDIIAQISRANAIFSLAPGRFGPTLVTRLLASRELLPLCAQTIMPYYRARAAQALAWVREKFAGLPLKAHHPDGAIFLWLWFPGLPISSETLYQRLKKRGVLVVSGAHFFPADDADTTWRHRDECIRITYAADAAQVERGIHIIAQEVRSAYAN